MKNILLPSIGMSIVFIMICIPFCLLVLHMEKSIKLKGYKSATEFYLKKNTLNREFKLQNELNQSNREPDIYPVFLVSPDQFMSSSPQTTKSLLLKDENYNNNFHNLLTYKNIGYNNLSKNAISLNLLKNSSDNLQKLLVINSTNNSTLKSDLNQIESTGMSKIDALPDEPWAAGTKDEIYVLILLICAYLYFKIKILI